MSSFSSNSPLCSMYQVVFCQFKVMHHNNCWLVVLNIVWCTKKSKFSNFTNSFFNYSLNYSSACYNSSNSVSHATTHYYQGAATSHRAW